MQQLKPLSFVKLVKFCWVRSYNQNTGFVRNKSSFQQESICIPTLHGDLTGVLWKTSNSVKSKTAQSPIICLHGIQDNCGTFDPLIPMILNDNRTFFAFDLPGHGLSYHTKGIYYDFFLDGFTSLHKILKHFQWDKATLLGHSLGAVISFMFSATYPERVHKFIAMDNLRPVPGTNLPKRYRVIVESILKTESVLQSGNERASYSYEEMVDKVVTARNKTVSREGCEALLRRGAERIAGTDRYRFTHDIRTNVPKPFRMISAEQSEQMGSQIKCPVCMIKGDPGEDYEPREDFVKYVENLRKTSSSPVEYYTVPGTHHFHLNTPELVAPIINKFLSS